MGDEMKMQKSNPYSPASPANDSLMEGEARRGDRISLPMAFAVGVGCCLIGPVFLALFNWYHAAVDNKAVMMRLFVGGYFGPGLLFVGIGLLIGFGLSRVCRNLGLCFDCRTRRVVVVSLIVVLFGCSISLLLNNSLNFDVGVSAFALPAFSVACGICVLVTTSVYLGLG